MNRFCVMSVDPGATGAMAFIVYEDGQESYDVFDYTDDLRPLKNLISDYKPNICYIEKVASMPGQGVVSVFSFGRNYGRWEGLLGGEIPFETVTPKAWQKTLGLIFDKEPVPKELDRKSQNRIKAVNKNKQKVEHLIFARKRFPKAELNLRKHEGRADALLIALHGVRNSYLKSNFK